MAKRIAQRKYDIAYQEKQNGDWQIISIWGSCCAEAKSIFSQKTKKNLDTNDIYDYVVLNLCPVPGSP